MQFYGGAATSSGNDLIMRQSRKRREEEEEKEGEDGNKKEPQRELDRRKLDVISKKGEIMEVQGASLGEGGAARFARATHATSRSH